MATLNSSETTDLRELMNLLDTIQRHGYKPPEDDTVAARRKQDPRDLHIERMLQLHRRRIHTLVQMKGYYPR